MILSSLSLALVLFTMTLSQPIKRQTSAGSAAAAAALLLNEALAYEICIIASGGFAAVQAIQGGINTTSPVCVAPTLPSTNAVSLIAVTGCVTAPSSNVAIYNCRNNDIISSAGYAYAGPISTRDPFYFTIPSSNSQCSGVSNPFLFGGVNNSPIGTDFDANTWNVDCNTGLVSLSNSSLHLCLANYQLYSTVDTTCASNFTISVLTFAPPAI